MTGTRTNQTQATTCRVGTITDFDNKFPNQPQSANSLAISSGLKSVPKPNKSVTNSQTAGTKSKSTLLIRRYFLSPLSFSTETSVSIASQAIELTPELTEGVRCSRRPATLSPY